MSTRKLRDFPQECSGKDRETVRYHYAVHKRYQRSCIDSIKNVGEFLLKLTDLNEKVVYLLDT